GRGRSGGHANRPRCEPADRGDDGVPGADQGDCCARNARDRVREVARMRVLFLGDLVGSCGREAVIKLVPRLREQHRLDYVIANGENVAGGRGITAPIAEKLFDAGVDIISGGNHTFRYREIYPYLNDEPNILRPANYPPGAPGHGVAEVPGLTVINLIGRTFM